MTANHARSDSEDSVGYDAARGPLPWELDFWNAVTLPQLVGVLAFIGWVAAAASFSDDQWVPILDSANLAFHEAGHPLLGLFGPTLGLYGGTLGQLVFPLITTAAFLQRRQAHAVAACGAWCGENLLNIGRYMADARAQELPLVGGGEHDWWHIFTRWGLLERDTLIGGATRGFGWLVMFACAGALVWLWRAQRQTAA